ncbi:MAG: DUF4838 domain-containing protein, partial [Bacteroidales bacterium]|nr:DUF4838 domain-containing protein [Bacteroidales bacterium]
MTLIQRITTNFKTQLNSIHTRGRIYLTILIGIALSSFAYPQELDLMTQKDWEIVVDKEAIPSEKFAAEEFQSLFMQVTGFRLKIVNSTSSKSKNIFIGYSPHSRNTGATVDTKNLGKEGLRIKITQNNITIEGGRPRGTLYGVYEFAERYLGIRFLTNDYTYVPSKKNKIIIPSEEFTYKPCFVYRSVYYTENMKNPEFSVRLRLNAFEDREKYGGRCDMEFVNHSFYYQLPVDSFKIEHPEYFAEVDGKRMLEAHGGGPQLCVSNPDVIKILTNAVLDEIKDNPEKKNVSVSQNDNNYYCRCKNCEVINKRENSPMGSHLTMINQVADEVSRKYPDVEVGTLAYQYTRKPPKKVIPNDNVMIQLCSIECDLLHSFQDKSNKMNKPFVKDLTRWVKISNNIWIWDYIVNFSCYGLPLPNLRSIGDRIKYYSESNIKGVFMQANYSGLSREMSDLRNYITAKCLWKPGSDSWELTKEFCHLYYQNSARPIL